MKRSFNYTGRKRLPTSCFLIAEHERQNQPSVFDIAVTSDPTLEIPSDSVIWLEAYRGPKIVRVCLGTWATPTSIKGENPFSIFDFREPIAFRIKVVDERDPRHLIRAWRDSITPVVYGENGKKKKSILPVHPCNLGSVPWDLDWEDESRPILRINIRIAEERDVTAIVRKDPDFAALVFPEVIRQVLTRLVTNDSGGDDEDDPNPWLVFAKSLYPLDAPIDDDSSDFNKDVDNWVNGVVQSFCERMQLISRYSAMKNQPG